MIATGSTATIPPIPGLRETGFLTHIEALQRERLPASLIVIGAGALGLEFSQLFARFGTRVSVLQRPATVFPRTEVVLAQRLTEILAHEGLDVITSAQPTAAARVGDRKQVTFEVDGRTATIETDEILLAAGKTPNTAALALHAAGVTTDARQAITVNAFLQTSAAHIYAAGDVAALPARLPLSERGRFPASHVPALPPTRRCTAPGWKARYGYLVETSCRHSPPAVPM